MIIVRTPFRISFAGGGSDLPTFYKRHQGCVLSATINKYMYVSVHKYFDDLKTFVKYSRTEIVDDPRELQHPIIRSVLLDANVRGIDITSIADIPAGTGLGSSSAYTVGLLHAIAVLQGRYVSKEELAAQACEVEIEKLGEPIGKQDQYAAACGGINFISFFSDGRVDVEKLCLTPETVQALENNLVMVYLGNHRSAGEILEQQSANVTSQAAYFANVKHMTDIARDLKVQLQQGNLSRFGELLHEGWELKRSLTAAISNEQIDRYYKLGRSAGALGGKLLGAGGGGFLLFYVEPDRQKRVRSALSDLKEVRFRFDYGGTKVVYYVV